MSRPSAERDEQRIRELVDRMLSLPTQERADFLERECAGDGPLKHRVESLVSEASEQRRRSYAAAPTLDPGTAAPIDVTEPVPEQRKPAFEQIGHYKLLEMIGEGGFGTVWVADQQRPVRRRVALKIIKPGMDSKAVIARFEQERQALAIMDHPNIAKVLDAGTAPDGRPYFVMEYVAGEAITTYCDRNRLNVQQRLELFLPICEAVQHAHHKGIIHRDIKPSNVLITVASGNPVVKVIDFGVAKAVSHTLTDKTLFTEQGQILGTPEYMSPEQAEMGALDIDTRTDVYSLGVLLYELLTGALPFEPHDLRSHGYNEIQRIIREVDPPRPSVRLRSLGKESTEIAQKRKARLEELANQLRRELEWIPLKAMRKDRRERYETPAALADDIRNHLAGRPLVAGPESALYRARKFVYRNKIGVSAAALVALALLLGAIVSTIGFIEAARNAERYRLEFLRAENEAERALAEFRRMQQINDFTNTMLRSANPAAGDRRDVTVRELLEDAVTRVEAGALKGEPRIEAAVRATLALTFRSLSLWDAAETQWRKALDLETEAVGADSIEVAAVLVGLGQVQMDTGRLDEAERSLRQALSIQRRKLPGDDFQLGLTVSNLGLLALLRGDFATARDRFLEAQAIFEKHPHHVAHLADVATNLAVAQHKLGDTRSAIETARGALELRREVFGTRSVDVWNSLINLASMQEAIDDLPAAEQSRRRALALARELVGDEHRMTVQSLSAVARTLWLRGGTSLVEAESFQTRALELARAVDGEPSVAVAQALDLLGLIERDRGNIDAALPLHRRALEIRTAVQGPDHHETATALTQLADTLTRAQQGEEATELALRALEIRKRVYPPGHWAIATTTSVLGGAYAAAGNYVQAEPLLLEGYTGIPSDSVLLRRFQREAALRIVNLYDNLGNLDEADKWRARINSPPQPPAEPQS